MAGTIIKCPLTADVRIRKVNIQIDFWKDLRTSSWIWLALSLVAFDQC